MAMTGTEFARVSGSYSTAYIGTYQVKSQNVANNTTTFTLRGYFYYGGGSSVSSSNSTFKLDGTTIKTGSYSYSNGYHLLGTKQITVTHNNDGTFPGRSVKIIGDSYHIDGSKSGNITAPKINRLAIVTSGMDFNDEENPTIAFTNPANYQVAPYMNFWLNDVRVVALERPKGDYTSPYTWELTEAERTQIRNALSNTNSCVVTEGVETYNGNTNLGYNAVKKTFVIVNSAPTFNYFEFEDINTTTTALTGNNQKIIKNYSNVKVTIPEQNKAIANKGATMLKYMFTCENNQVDIPYSDSTDVNGTINNVQSGVFTVFAVDSRSRNSNVQALATSTIDYTELIKGNINVVRQTGTSEETVLTLDGQINLVNFGSVTNSIKVAKTRYKQSNSDTWSNYSNITIVVDNNGNFSFNDLIQGDTTLGFDEANSYNIEVVISDELSTITYTANLGSAIPNIALHKDGVGIMGKYDTTEGGYLQIRGKDIFSRLFYQDNDTFEVLTELNCIGMLSGGRKGVYFTIPVEKKLDFINRFTINSLICQIRHSDGGYIANNVELSSIGTLAIAKSSNNTLYVVLTLTIATSMTNNAPVTVSIESCRITFNESSQRNANNKILEEIKEIREKEESEEYETNNK